MRDVQPQQPYWLPSQAVLISLFRYAGYCNSLKYVTGIDDGKYIQSAPFTSVYFSIMLYRTGAAYEYYHSW